MYRAENIIKNYDQRTVLKGVSLRADAGETLGVICPDDEERAALMDILGGALVADGGTISVDDMTLEAETGHARNMIGYIPATPPVQRDMTPRAAMKFQADARGLTVREASDAIDGAIKLLKLQDVCDKPASRLSDGALRLVSIAQAVFFGPRALIIDEPTRDLDPKEIIALRQALKQISYERSVILASGSVTELCALCDRVAVLSGGRIVWEGRVDELQDMAAETCDLVVTVGADEKTLVTALGGLQGVSVAKTEDVAGGCRATLTCSGDMRALVALTVVNAGMPLWGLAPATKPLQEVVEGLRSDRLRPAPAEGEAAEGNGEEA